MAHLYPISRSAASLLLTFAVLLSAALLPSVASARVESLRWEETSASSLVGFRVYSRATTGAYGTPVYDGMPTPDSAGIYQFDLTLPDDQTVVVAVTAYDANGLESALSNERQYDGIPPASPSPGGGGSGLTNYRVNAGGNGFTDSLGNTWEADSAYVTGGTTLYYPTMPISNTPEQYLYQTNRYANNVAAPIRYELPVPDGTYLVRIHFQEPWESLAVGQRVFDVLIEGAIVLDDFDLLPIVQTWGVPEVQEFTVDVVDGSLSVHFDDVVLYPTLSALEVEETTASTGGTGTSGDGSGGTGTGGDGSDGTGTGGTGTGGTGTGGTGGTGGTTTMGAPGQPQIIE